MGWTSEYVRFTGKDTKEIKKYFLELWNSETKFEALDYSKVGNTIYMAVRNLETDHVFASIILISFEDGELFYKDMTDSAGPCRYDCPKRILNKLTPTDSEYAIEWREKCFEKHEQHKASSSLGHGAVIQFPSTISFTDDFESSKFILLKEGRRTVFAPYTDQESLKNVRGYYQIRKWKDRSPEVIGKLY